MYLRRAMQGWYQRVLTLQQMRYQLSTAMQVGGCCCWFQASAYVCCVHSVYHQYTNQFCVLSKLCKAVSILLHHNNHVEGCNTSLWSASWLIMRCSASKI